MSNNDIERHGNRPVGHDKFTVWDPERENAHHFSSRPDAERKLEMATDLDIDAELYEPGSSPEALYHADSDPSTTGDQDDTADNQTTNQADQATDPTEPCAICGDPVNISEARAGPDGQPSHSKCVIDNRSDSVDADIIDHSPDTDTDTDTDTDSNSNTDPAPAPDPKPAPDPAPAPDSNHEPEALSPDEIERHAANLDDREVGQDPLKWMPGEFVDTIEGQPAINRKGFEVLRFFYDIDLDMTREVDPVDNDMTHCRYKCTATTADGSEIEAWGTSHVDRGDDPWLLIEMAATRARKRALSIATGAGAVAVEELKSDLQ